MQLTNKTDQYVAFKVKTTNPKGTVFALMPALFCPILCAMSQFNKEDGKVVDDFRLRVVFVPANRPSPVPEGDEEGTSPGTSSAEDEIKKSSLPEAAWSVVSKLNEEKASIIKQNQKLLGELELMQKRSREGQRGGVSVVVVVVGLLLGILVGYLIRK
ncbi:UNVERIFIED_CONTAM: Vesicle-associated protein 1-3 [Sesamum radiatum]|uniref:Vesicle-associated protein 1-3 n=1 Tax=Sesamum radiatum TaxID=300843 RepID=A0AAW2VA27_SESRA